MNKQTWLLLAFTLLMVAAAVGLPAVPQPPDYHQFADQRHALGVDNFLDVVSNGAFLLAGIAGLVIVLRRTHALRTRQSSAGPGWCSSWACC